MEATQKVKDFIGHWIVCCLILSMISSLEAASINELKIRIKQRKPNIDQLLKDHKIGENNKGYLTIREELTREEKKWVKTENKDRYQLYDKVAAETDYYVSQKEIADQRARNIRVNAPRGIWIQRKQGHWMLNK